MLPDLINNPEHYKTCSPNTRYIVRLFCDEDWLKGKCIDALEFYGFGYHLATAIAYLWREDRKGGNADLKKALWYFRRQKEKVFNSPQIEQAIALTEALLDGESLDSGAPGDRYLDRVLSRVKSVSGAD